MSHLIHLNQVIILSGIHLLLGLLLYALGHRLLPKNYRIPLAGFLGVVWASSLIALLTFYFQEIGFWGWLFDPSGEKNFTALFNTTLLMLIACSSVSLLWSALQKRRYILSLYWLLVAALFIFLAIDEYFSIHEAIVFWRGGYLILGGTVGLLSIVVMFRSNSYPRNPMLLFIIGLAVMGVSGVVLDAFSTENVLDIGPIVLGFIRCRGTFLGVYCREFSNTEEMMELFGAGLMWLSLTALIYHSWSKPELALQRRFINVISIAWLLILILWMWLVPTIQARFAIPATTHYGDISLIGYDISSHQIAAGDRLNITLYMESTGAMDSIYSMSLHLYTQGTDALESIAQDDMQLGDFVYPTQAWIPHLAVRNPFQLEIPEDLATNQSYQLVAIVWEESVHNRVPIETTIFPIYADGTTLIIDGIAAPASDTPPTSNSVSYTFAEGIALTGYRVPNEVLVGEEVTLDFWWQSDAELNIAATQFLHWFNIDTGEYTIFDQIPFDGRFPTQDWVAGMHVLDSWTLSLPDDMPAGTYRIHTGMFETESAERLSVTDSSGAPVQDNSIALATITVR